MYKVSLEYDDPVRLSGASGIGTNQIGLCNEVIEP
jgi:hypothetical protein